MENKEKTLLEKCREVELYKRKMKQEITPEWIEMAVAWARNEITYLQIQKVTGMKGSNLYSVLSLALKYYIQSLPKTPTP